MARATAAERDKQQLTRAGNVAIGMAAYGLHDPDAQALTPLGEALRATPDDSTMYAEFAKHILTNRFGIEVLDAIRTLQRRSIKVGKLTLATELRKRGFELPTATTHHLTLLNWLGQAGVVTGRERVIDDAVLRTLLGHSSSELHEVLSLSAAQRAYLDTVHGLVAGRTGVTLNVRHVDAVAIENYGDIFGPEDRRKALVRDPLIAGGWFTVTATGRGRGGKSGSLAATMKLIAGDAEVFRRPRITALPVDVLDHLDKPLAEIYSDLDSTDTGVKGLALELLAINMAYDLGLVPVDFRLRAKETTGQTEVDLLAEGIGLHFSRWVFQCKNTASKADVKVVVREAGVADVLHAHVIVVVSRKGFTRDTDAVRTALARATEKQVVLVGSKELERYARGGKTTLLEFFREQALATMDAKRDQGLRLLDEFKGVP